jgi:hypothetical protein
MINDEGLSVRESSGAAADFRCGRSPGYADSRTTRRVAAADERTTHPPA